MNRRKRSAISVFSPWLSELRAAPGWAASAATQNDNYCGDGRAGIIELVGGA